ncbi:hypothetical protein BDZ91DRAFT_717953 [Kalaharituber pfeilii]|nr:hypothetical protein BDZ91DRAFT_717953 [Kalaharituber pfeilii]
MPSREEQQLEKGSDMGGPYVADKEIVAQSRDEPSGRPSCSRKISNPSLESGDKAEYISQSIDTRTDSRAAIQSPDSAAVLSEEARTIPKERQHFIENDDGFRQEVTPGSYLYHHIHAKPRMVDIQSIQRTELKRPRKKRACNPAEEPEAPAPISKDAALVVEASQTETSPMPKSAYYHALAAERHIKLLSQYPESKANPWMRSLVSILDSKIRGPSDPSGVPLTSMAADVVQNPADSPHFQRLEDRPVPSAMPVIARRESALELSQKANDNTSSQSYSERDELTFNVIGENIRRPNLLPAYSASEKLTIPAVVQDQSSQDDQTRDIEKEVETRVGHSTKRLPKATIGSIQVSDLLSDYSTYQHENRGTSIETPLRLSSNVPDSQSPDSTVEGKGKMKALGVEEETSYRPVTLLYQD